MNRKNIVGPKIRIARNNSGMSQEKLAARLQVLGIRIDRSAIAKIETGRRPVSDIEIAGIVETLDIELSWLFADRKDWFRNQPDQGSIESKIRTI